jgi:hypothetical protein
MPDYSRFNVIQKQSRFSLLDTKTGWCWEGMRKYDTVLAMMNHILTHPDMEDFQSDEYRRLRKLEGHEWERELEG